MNEAMKGLFRFHLKMKNFGYSPSLNGHEKRKLGIFNLMNFFGILAGVLIPFMGWSKGHVLPAIAW